MSDISIDALIRYLTGATHSGDQSLIQLSPAARRALAQELRERIDQNSGGKGSGGEIGDDDLADTMRLAAYLDGRMEGQEKATFENELAQNPDRRNALISALA